jgi:GTP-binding protein HflX
LTQTIHGQTSGLSPSDVHALTRLYRRRVPLDRLLTPELTRSLAEVSTQSGRQVGLLVDRSGDVRFVVVGDHQKLMLPDLGRHRAADGRLRGLRLLHTHLSQEGLTRDDLVDLVRLKLDLVLALCVSPDGEPTNVHYAHNVAVPDGTNRPPYEIVGPIPWARAELDVRQKLTDIEDDFAHATRARKVQGKDGRAILVHVTDRRGTQAEESLRELDELARTAGLAVVDRILQVRDRIDPKYILGRGKLDDVVVRSMQLDATVLVFDCELAPSQASAIAALTDMKVIDRTQLILDIFAQRAESRDGKLQVELAQMKYLLPRLGQKDDALSRLTGGIGGRGPGETVLEIGKRRARERISRLEHQLKTLAVQRKQRRHRRGRRDVPIVSIVGYTNAGKSTLLNALTGADTLAEDKLFATLDTRSRRIRFPREREVVITDTVGFIRDLPSDLFAAFRATFEEAEDADLLLHVVDASDPSMSDHMRTTERLLGELDLATTPTLLVFNKADRLPPGDAERMAEERGGVAISATDRTSLHALLLRVEAMLFPGGEMQLVASVAAGEPYVVPVLEEDVAEEALGEPAEELGEEPDDEPAKVAE